MTRPLRIAVADDEPELRQYFARILPRLGHKLVAVAANGHELVHHCRAQRPDLIITDSKLAELSGIAAALDLTTDHPIPVIVFSSHDAPPNHGGNDHIVEYLVKPIKLADLAQAISKAADSLDPEQA